MIEKEKFLNLIFFSFNFKDFFENYSVLFQKLFFKKLNFFTLSLFQIET
jgi:hypothetical protein